MQYRKGCDTGWIVYQFVEHSIKKVNMFLFFKFSSVIKAAIVEKKILTSVAEALTKLFVYFLGLGFIQRMTPSSTAKGAPAQRQRKNYMYSLPIQQISQELQASRQRAKKKTYVPTSMLSEEEKAARRERVRLQVRASRLRKKLRQAGESLNTNQGGFYHFPKFE